MVGDAVNKFTNALPTTLYTFILSIILPVACIYIYVYICVCVYIRECIIALVVEDLIVVVGQERE